METNRRVVADADRSRHLFFRSSALQFDKCCPIFHRDMRGGNSDCLTLTRDMFHFLSFLRDSYLRHFHCFELRLKPARRVAPGRYTQGIPVFTTYLREREHSSLSCPSDFRAGIGPSEESQCAIVLWGGHCDRLYPHPYCTVHFPYLCICPQSAAYENGIYATASR